MAAPHEAVPFLQNPETWVAAGFLVFIAALGWLGVHKQIGAGLDARAAKIRADLNEAEKLRLDAEALLADAEARLARAESDAEQILENARTSAAQLAARAEADLNRRIERRTADAEGRIAAAERAAAADLRARAAALATEAARQIITERSGAGLQATLTDRAIEEVSARL